MKGWYSPENISRVEYTADDRFRRCTVEYHGLDVLTLREDMDKCPFCGRPSHQVTWSRTEPSEYVSMTFDYPCFCIIRDLNWRSLINRNSAILSFFGIKPRRMQL